MNPVPVARPVDYVLYVQRQDFSVTVQPPVLYLVVSPVRSVLNVPIMANGSISGYLDDWLIRAPTRESCHQGTQSLLALCQELG